MEHAEIESIHATQFLLAYICPSNQCSDCPEGRDPDTQCQDCLSDFFGSNCNACGDCHRGKCKDGMAGDGSCVCENAFDAATYCSDCLSGYYGAECVLSCPRSGERVCSDNGVCDDGIDGLGRCSCQEDFVGLSGCRQGR